MRIRSMFTFFASMAVFMSCSGPTLDPIVSSFLPDPGIYGVWISGATNMDPAKNFIGTAFIPVLRSKDQFTNGSGFQSSKFDDNNFQILQIYHGQDSAGKPIPKFRYCKKADGNTVKTSTGSGSVFVQRLLRTAFSVNDNYDDDWQPTTGTNFMHFLIFSPGNTNALIDCQNQSTMCDVAVISGAASQGEVRNVFYRVNSHKTKTIIGVSPSSIYDEDGKFQWPDGC